MDGQFTYQQAADPSSPGELLAEIAYHRPDLRPAVARNPAAYPGLLEWLAQLRDPAVDAALRTRVAPGGGPTPGPAQTLLTPMAPGPASASPAPTAPAGGYLPPGLSATEASGYGPTQAGPYGGAGVPTGQPTTAPSPKSRAWIWIVVVVAVVAVVGAVLVGIAIIRTVTDVAEDVIPEISQPGGYGDDADLDALWDSCEAGDMAACDELYRSSLPGTDYHEFGDTCGGRTEGGTWCDSASAG